MQWFKRIALFLIVNLLVILSISVLLSIFHVQPYLNEHGLDMKSLLTFCLIWGFVGSLISLALSRIMAKWIMGVKVIDPRQAPAPLQDVARMVEVLALRSQMPTPEVGIFNSPDVNAFATGPTKKRSLIAISTGALEQLSKPELEAVLGHEMTHIANGDMVTMTLLQGLVNAFVMFFARILAYAIAMGSKDNKRSPRMSYYLLVYLFEIVFMLLGSIVIAAYSRWREYRADAGGAALAGRQNMIEALNHLETIQKTRQLTKAQQSLAPFMIHSRSEPTLITKLFSTHPPLKERVERLRHQR